MMFVSAARAGVLAARAAPSADGGRRDPDRDQALRVGALAERRGCRRRAAADGRSGPRRAPCRRPGTARRSAPLPSADARHWWSPAAMTTAPRLWALLPDVTVQRVEVERRRRPASVIGSPPWGRGRAAGRGCGRRRGPVAVVKWRSSRRRSSAPDFQIAYSSESARAGAEAAMMFVSLPIVDHVRAPSVRVDDDPGARRRRRAAVEDAHLVVDQVDVVELRVERAERLAQRGVERVDRAVAVGGGVQHLAVDLDLDGRLGQQLAAVALLDEARCSRRSGTAAA